MKVLKENSNKPHECSLAFRKSFESLNLGVVPTDPSQLINLTIGADEIQKDILGVLRNAQQKGAYRVYSGYYGSGKSHHLQLIRAIALQEGWVTASVELDPKSVDPAKANTVYQSLIAGLEFPKRKNGEQNEDFCDLIMEIRENWNEIRTLPYFMSSPWYSTALNVLRLMPHNRNDSNYMTAINWLGGQIKLISAIQQVANREGFKGKVPKMPNTNDCSYIYIYHLVVLNQILKKLGYRGLVLILDEAEHVRNYNIRMFARASNFFSILEHCARKLAYPIILEEIYWEKLLYGMPEFWNEGPHFALFIGLTEQKYDKYRNNYNGGSNLLSNSEWETVYLNPPDAEEYEKWVRDFLVESSRHLGNRVKILSDPAVSNMLANTMRNQFESVQGDAKKFRNWTKLAGFPVSVLLSQRSSIGSDVLQNIVNRAASDISGDWMPWDD